MLILCCKAAICLLSEIMGSHVQETVTATHIPNISQILILPQYEIPSNLDKSREVPKHEQFQDKTMVFGCFWGILRI